jgi:hypothetical protein
MSEVKETPKKPRKVKAEIVPLPPPVEIRLGSLAIADPKEMIHRAAQLADALAEIVNTQMDEDGKPKLFVKIQGRKYVKADGWTTLGAMLGVVPVEESCTRLPTESGFKGFEAKVKLVRMVDGAQVGGASAECTLNENNWKGKDSFTLRSMAITRATGKAFRLSFAWIMQLAGFEPVPADELWVEEGSAEDQEEVLKKKLADLEEKKAERSAKKEENKMAKVCAFITWPEAHNGHKFFLTGKTAIMEHGLFKFVEEVCGAKWNEREGGWFLPSELAPGVRLEFAEKKCPIVERDYTGLLQESIRQAKERNGDTERGKSATPVS